MIQKDSAAFFALFRAHPLPMWLYDLESLRFLAVNTAAVQHYGYSEAEFLAMSIADIRPPEDLTKLQANLRSAPQASLEKAGLWRHLKKDGSLIDVEITSHPATFERRACRFVLALDVTERLAAQNKIGRLNRIYSVLSRINSTIVRVRERPSLFQETCRIASLEGEFVAAYICELRPGAQLAQIVAHAGEPIFHSTALPLAPLPFVCNALQADPALAALLQQEQRARHLALAAFPLFDTRQVGAALVLVTPARDYFDQAECRLLNELAADVSFAIQYIEREDEHWRLTSRLQESEAGLRRAQLSNKCAHVITGPDGSFESWSETLAILLGLTDAQMPTSTRAWLDLLHPDDRARFRGVCLDAGRSGARVDIDYRIAHADAHYVQFRQVMEPLTGYRSAEGRMRWFNTIQDVSQQKQEQENEMDASHLKPEVR